MPDEKVWFYRHVLFVAMALGELSSIFQKVIDYLSLILSALRGLLSVAFATDEYVADVVTSLTDDCIASVRRLRVT